MERNFRPINMLENKRKSKRTSDILNLVPFSKVLILILLTAIFVLPAAAQDEKKIVRVGWHEEPYFITDQFGRRTGYSYEFQRKLVAYTGWTYEYVEGSWSELLQMLKDGEIDLLSDVSYMEERTKDMLYASIPMGTESYYVFISPDNNEITAEDYTSLNGKKIGAARGSIQYDYFVKWAEAHGISAEIVGLTTTEDESLLMLQDGTLDAFVTMDVYGNQKTAIPVCKIGSSEFYFAVSKSRPDLLIELDAAMNMIQDEDKYFSQQLNEQFLKSTETNLYLSTREKAWLNEHGPIRVGYQDNYLAFCAADPETGELTGALKDYLEYASAALVNAKLDFQTVAFPTAAAAIETMKNGEIDCMVPANLSSYDGEELGVVMTPAIMRTEMDAVVRASEQKEFIRKKQVTVAVNQGNTNYDMFLADHYPDWNRAYFVDTPAGLEAVAAGDADCVIISNYRYSNISKQCEKLHLATVYTGVDMDYYFAVNEGETELYSILARVTNVVPNATINAALTYYSTEDVKTSFSDLVKDNLFIIMTVIAGILLIILILLLHSIHAERKAREEEQQIQALNKRVFVDALTSVRNKGAFDEYIQDLQDRLDKGEKLEFAIGVFDCDNLKKINDQNGHDKGNIYLKTASQLICRVFQHSPVFRIGGDEFSVILQNEDFRKRAELAELFVQTEKEICASAANSWDEVHTAYGIADYDPESDDSVHDTVRRADKLMYENKRKNHN